MLAQNEQVASRALGKSKICSSFFFYSLEYRRTGGSYDDKRVSPPIFFFIYVDGDKLMVWVHFLNFKRRVHLCSKGRQRIYQTLLYCECSKTAVLTYHQVTCLLVCRLPQNKTQIFSAQYEQSTMRNALWQLAKSRLKCSSPGTTKESKTNASTLVKITLSRFQPQYKMQNHHK